MKAPKVLNPRRNNKMGYSIKYPSVVTPGLVDSSIGAMTIYKNLVCEDGEISLTETACAVVTCDHDLP